MIWVDGSGKATAIEDMDNRHLLNAHRHVREELIRIQNAFKFMLDPFFGPHGEMAQDAASIEEDEMIEDEIRLGLFLREMGDEIKRRRLRPKHPRVVLENPPKIELIGDGTGRIDYVARLKR